MGTRGNISFDQLVHNIVEIDTKSQAYAIKSINLIQTVRNWLIGGYIVEYEQHGNDRAKYGEQLLKRLSLCLKDQRYNVTLLKNSRSFYLSYPLIGQYIQKSPTLSDFSAKFISIDSGFPFKNNTLPICPTLSDTFSTPAETVLEKLSFYIFRIFC